MVPPAECTTAQRYQGHLLGLKDTPCSNEETRVSLTERNDCRIPLVRPVPLFVASPPALGICGRVQGYYDI